MLQDYHDPNSTFIDLRTNTRVPALLTPPLIVYTNFELYTRVQASFSPSASMSGALLSVWVNIDPPYGLLRHTAENSVIELGDIPPDYHLNIENRFRPWSFGTGYSGPPQNLNDVSFTLRWEPTYSSNRSLVESHGMMYLEYSVHTDHKIKDERLLASTAVYANSRNLYNLLAETADGIGDLIAFKDVAKAVSNWITQGTNSLSADDQSAVSDFLAQATEKHESNIDGGNIDTPEAANEYLTSITSLRPSGIADVVLDITANGLREIAGGYNDIVSDPPRYDYHVLYDPEDYTMPLSVASYFNPVEQELFDAQINLRIQQKALLLANERYLGAVGQNASEFADQQSGLAIGLTMALSENQIRVSRALDAMVNQLVSELEGESLALNEVFRFGSDEFFDGLKDIDAALFEGQYFGGFFNLLARELREEIGDFRSSYVAADFADIASFFPNIDMRSHAQMADDILSTLSGDYNGDGRVDSEDYEAWRSQYGMVTDQYGTGADGNADGMINAADYSVWRDNLLVISAPTQSRAVPEPSQLMLACLAIVAAIVASSRDQRSVDEPSGAQGDDGAEGDIESAGINRLGVRNERVLRERPSQSSRPRSVRRGG